MRNDGDAPPRFGPVTHHTVTSGGTMASRIDVSAKATNAKGQRKDGANRNVAELVADWGADASEIRALVKASLKQKERREKVAEIELPTQRWKQHRSENSAVAWVPLDWRPPPSTNTVHGTLPEHLFSVSVDEWNALDERLRWMPYDTAVHTMRVIEARGQCWPAVAEALDGSVSPIDLELWYAEVKHAVVSFRLQRLAAFETDGHNDLLAVLRNVLLKAQTTLTPAPAPEAVALSLAKLRQEITRISTADVDKQTMKARYLDLCERLDSAKSRVAPDLTVNGAFSEAEDIAWGCVSIANEVRQSAYNTVNTIPTVLADTAILTLPNSADALYRKVEVTLETILEDDSSDGCATPTALAHIDMIRTLLATNSYLHRQLQKLVRVRAVVEELRTEVADFVAACEDTIT